jgi:hypothetical protein
MQSLKSSGYTFQTFEQFLVSPLEKAIILRHDVDLLPLQSLKTARIENQLGILSTYYFRIIPESNKPDIIREIASLGHEIGYHYEDMSDPSNLTNENLGRFENAIISFKTNLEYFRQFYPVRTISMHGSPMSKYDNRDLWKHYNYKDFGLTGEPYFDIDFSKVMYLTDTGRRWDGESVSVRDKVNKAAISQYEKNSIMAKRIKTTRDIIRLAEENELPPQIMITVHPQRWSNNPLVWLKELAMQNTKNLVKRFIVNSKETDY